MIQIFYVDDEWGDSVSSGMRYQERLSSAADLECQLVPPPEWSNLDEFVASTPDLYLIDYQLGMVQPDGSKADYQGSTLAAEIRARLPDCPIVLITRQLILDQLDPQTSRQIKGHMPMYDGLILKDRIDDKLEETQRLLVSIADGFRILGGTTDAKWQSLVNATGADDDEGELLQEAAPPVQKGAWIVTEAAGWIRDVVLGFPGILYDPVNAATRLGVSEEAFLAEEVQELVRSAGYQGVFAPYEGRWWKGRLFRIAAELAADQGVHGPINQAFPEAFHGRFGRQLPPAECVWDHTPIPNWVCHVLRKPVKIKHSLRYYPDNRPSIMDQARVSFRAVRESNDFDEELLDSEGSALQSEIEALPEP